MNGITILPLTKELAKSAAELEKACLETAWSETALLSLPENALYLVALDGKICVGTACMYFYEGGADLNNIAVLPEYRKSGIAYSLLCELIKQAKNNKCEFIALEVASDNIAALALYKKTGFTPAGIRKNFYGCCKDAVTMRLVLC